MTKTRLTFFFCILIFISCFATTAAGKTFGGIGALIRECEHRFFIAGTLDDSPSSKSGLKIGDEIIQIDGKTVQDKDLFNILKLMRGEVGTDLNLRLIRNDNNLDVSLKREKIKVPTYKQKILDNQIGYIKFYFNTLKIPDIKQIYSWFDSNAARALIIDFRNFKGFRDFRTNLYIIKIYSEGKSLGYAEDANAKRIKLKLKKKAIQPLTPLAIVVNNYTAGGAEMITLALKEYGKAYVIGKRTKGNTYTIKNSKKTPTHKYISPNGVNIHGKGIIPDKLVVTEECTLLDDSVIEMASNYLLEAMKK